VSNVIDAEDDLLAQAETIFAEDRIQAVVAVRTSGGALGYGAVDLGLLQAVVDTGNARGFSLSGITPAGEHVVLLFDPYEAPTVSEPDGL
jgi:hypothetical protein